jgi:D-tyrosyl-tRNA(Tyr) deacylase
VTGSTGVGLLVLLGVKVGDDDDTAAFLASKIVHLRIFEDADGKMNRSLLDIGGQMLVVSQFTLYADCRKGRRPSFTDATRPEDAQRLYQRFIAEVEKFGLTVACGAFQQDMHVGLVNDGPVTVIVEFPTEGTAVLEG